jgi:hypothetical protein
MANSLERLTGEQLSALLEEFSERAPAGSAAEEENTRELARILTPIAVRLGRSLMVRACEPPHVVCCMGTAVGLFSIGLFYGWMARERMIDIDKLEALVDGGAAEPLAWHPSALAGAESEIADLKLQIPGPESLTPDPGVERPGDGR